MDPKTEGYSALFLGLVLIVALVSISLPRAQDPPPRNDQGGWCWIDYVGGEELPQANAPYLPEVALRRVWQGFQLVPRDDHDTPLHFEVLANGQLGWGSLWLGQASAPGCPDRVMIRMESEGGRAQLEPLRSVLAQAGMMAPDASWGEN